MARTYRRKNLKHIWFNDLCRKFTEGYEIFGSFSARTSIKAIDWKSPEVLKEIAICHTDHFRRYYMPPSGYRKCVRAITKEKMRTTFRKWLNHPDEDGPLFCHDKKTLISSYL